MYFYGLGTDKDPVMALRWIVSAAVDGNLRAQYNAAKM